MIGNRDRQSDGKDKDSREQDSHSCIDELSDCENGVQLGVVTSLMIYDFTCSTRQDRW